MNSRLRNGMLCAVTAHFMWGLFPLFWRMLDAVPSSELVCHRVIWAFAVLALVIGIRTATSSRKSRQEFFTRIRSARLWAMHLISGVLIGINWLAFLWAVNSGRVLEASLGYYINPLINVFLGVVILGERLTVSQWTAITIAFVGVCVMTIAGGGLPWVSLAMAFSFAFYGLAKKKATVDPITGMFFETMVLSVPALLSLVWMHGQTVGAFGNLSWWTDILLMFGGVVTVVPLAFFAAAALRAPLAVIGILQYIGPTLQFLVGAVYFGEEFSGARLIGFVFVWIGSLIFLTGAVHRARQSLRESPGSSPSQTDPQSSAAVPESSTNAP